MRLRQLRYFLRICELGSITRAATELHIAQPALGLHVRSLEEEFGVSLLERGPRGVTTTQAGDLVVEWAREVLAQEQKIKRAVIELAGVEQVSFSVGLTPSLTYMLANPIIQAVSERYPDCAVKIVEGLSQHLIEWTEIGQIDFALTYAPVQSEKLTAVPILQERLFYLSGPGEGTAPIPLARILELPLAVADERNSMRQATEAAALSIGLPVRVKHEIGSQQVAKEIARSGTAGAISSFGGTIREQEAGEISARLIVEPMIERTLSLIRLGNTPRSRREAAFVSILYEELTKMAEASAGTGAYRMLASGITKTQDD